MKNMRAFQNLVGFIWMKFKREKINSENALTHFRDFYKFRSGADEIRKVLFLQALLPNSPLTKSFECFLKKRKKESTTALS